MRGEALLLDGGAHMNAFRPVRADVEPEPVIQEVAFGSDLYDQMAIFRDMYLRRPLGLTLSADDVAGEDQQVHIAALQRGEVVGTVILKPLTRSHAKLRQMAVAPELQGRGLGATLVRSAERLAVGRGFDTIEISSRRSAVGFYEKLGYRMVGEPFLEVGLPHISLTRSLRT